MQIKNTSSFWLDDTNNIDVLTGEKISTGKDYHKMAATLRAVSNFVNIVTGQNIPVTYSTKDESFTDGKQVVLSGNIKDKDYDSTVGLALHEGSHCLLTDFDIVINLMNGTNIPTTILDMVIEKYYAVQKVENQKWMAENYIKKHVKDLLNIIEDRRIDNYIYKNAPGYRGYYQAMYDKYFNSPIIDKALQSPEKRTIDWDSYMFRICNIVNVNRDITALPDLSYIFRKIDLRNIGRLTTTSECLDIAFDIFNIVENNIPKPTKKDKKSKDCDVGDCEKNKKNGESGDSCPNGNGKKAKTPNGKAESDDGSKAEGDEAKKGSSNKQGGTITTKDLKPLSDAQKRALINKIKDQKNFLGGETKKLNVSNADKKKINATKNSGSEFKHVAKGHKSDWNNQTGKGVKCLVVKNVTAQMADAGIYDTISSNSYWRTGTPDEVILNGIRLGTMLGRKLQVRNDENTLKYNRLRKGNIDKRMLASLGFGNEQVFQQIFTERFNPVNVHLSVDASGSMHGTKWEQAQTAAIAIAKAASMVQNLNVQISYRSTETVGNQHHPAIFIAYDSRKDKIGKITQLFGNIQCPGTTPEGLCFEAIQNEIIDGANGIDSYFINFSDGEPFFTNRDIEYSGDSAVKHTKTQVDNMRIRGIKVLSYFIGKSYGSNNFKTMYGNDAEFIDTNKLTTLTKSLNKRFATK